MNDNADTPESSSSETGGAASAIAATGMNAQQLAAMAAELDWTTVDLECPAGCVEIIGAEPVDLRVTVSCDCGANLRINLDGEHRARCPKCGTMFRHILVVQAEDADVSGAAAAVAAILAANR